MFDILSDVWAHPGASHSPILPFDVSALSADEAESEISRLHKCGFDCLLVYCKEPVLQDGTVEAVFRACAKRFMLVFADESVIFCDVGCTEDVLRAYTPMLCAHTLRLSDSKDTDMTPFEEIVASYYVKLSDGVISEAHAECPEEGEYVKYDVILTEKPDGIDLLSPEASEVTLSVYESFYEKYKDISAGVLVGIRTASLMRCIPESLPWSYDMAEEFTSLEGTPSMLLSLLAKTDKRSQKEGRRIYGKTLASRLEKCCLTPLSKWCGKNSLAFMGEVPYDFVGTCAPCFTLPIYDDKCFDSAVSTEDERMSAVQCLADAARHEGFTGVVYRSCACDADSLAREAYAATAASMALMMLPESFASAEHLSEIGINAADMKALCLRLRRYSTLGTSCSSKSSCAVLYDDGFIPFSGAAKLRELGVPFSFLSISQCMKRGHSHHGEFLVDRFRYKVLLMDQRVRPDPESVRHIGEFAAYGGTMYRGGQFGDFAKKHLGVSELGREVSKHLYVRKTVKCSHLFEFYANITNEPYVLKHPFEPSGKAYIFDSRNGKCYPLPCETSLEEYVPIRIPAGGDLIIAVDCDALPDITPAKPKLVSEIHAVASGENVLDVKLQEGSEAVIEFDSFDGGSIDIDVNGTGKYKVIARPLTAAVTEHLADGENTVTVKCCGSVSGGVLRITR